MADYKRFVSYMYEYENGTKKRNVGYARVETRNGECRFTIYMQLAGLAEGIFPTYLIHRPKEKMDLVYLGDCAVRNQVMDSRLTAKEDNIMDSGHRFSSIGGILLFLNSGVFYATQWDDKPVVLKDVLDALKPKSYIINESKSIEQESKVDEKLAVIGSKSAEEELPVLDSRSADSKAAILDRKTSEEKLPAFDSKSIDRSGPAFDSKSAEGKLPVLDSKYTKGKANMPENDSISNRPIYMLPGGYKSKEMARPTLAKAPVNPWDIVGKYKETVERDNKASAASSKNVIPNYIKPRDDMHKESPLAEKIFANYTRIYPFEDNEIIKSVKIEPKDIGDFPADTWILSNNSFLLHGYYCYHHLIFAQIVDRYGCRYIIGVPGIYHNRERFMARMFGFEFFKSIRKRELKQGDFGYWYVDVNF